MRKIKGIPRIRPSPGKAPAERRSIFIRPGYPYLLSIIKMAYQEFEQRIGQLQSPKGEKTSLVLHAIDRTYAPFSVAELQHRCPSVSVDMIRR
jgi:hypothetical protein